MFHSMLSGNCSVNATIITFNAPIKSRDSEGKRDRQRERVSESVRARGKSGFNQRSAFVHAAGEELELRLDQSSAEN